MRKIEKKTYENDLILSFPTYDFPRPLPIALSLFKGPDHSAQINGLHGIPDPPIRSAFNRRGGGSGIDYNLRAHLDGSETSAHIYGLN
jgi:hypothetical protein